MYHVLATLEHISQETKQIGYATKASFGGIFVKWANKFVTKKLETIHIEILGIKSVLVTSGLDAMSLEEYTAIVKIKGYFTSYLNIINDFPTPTFYTAIVVYNKVVKELDEVLEIYNKNLFDWDDYDTTTMSDETEWQHKQRNGTETNKTTTGNTPSMPW